MKNLFIWLLLWLGIAGQSTNTTCTTNGVILHAPAIFSNAFSVIPQGDLDASFRQYLYDRSNTNLVNYIMTIKSYVIPILVLVGIQIGILIFAGARRLYRRRQINKQPEEFSKITVVMSLIGACLAATAVIIIAALTIVATYSSSNTISQAKCQTNLSISQFQNGQTDKWIGVNNVATQANNSGLAFNNYVRQLKSGLVGLTINGTKLGLPLNATFTTMQALVTGAFIGNYLYSNTSANAKRFPICQTTPILLPNPDGSGTQVRMSHQQTICDALTNESTALIGQAQSLDTMNAQLTSLISSRDNIYNNITALSNSYTAFVNGSNLNSISLSSINDTGILLSYVMAGAQIGLGLFLFIVFVARNERLTKVYPALYVLMMIMGVFSAVVSIWYMTSSAAIYSSCYLYNEALSNRSIYNEVASKFNMSSSLDPLYFCASNPTSTFLNSSQMVTSMGSLANLTLLQTNFNNSIPANVLTSKAIEYLSEVSAYLADISTVSINGTTSVQDLLISINKIGDYTYPGSTQAPSCNVSMDQFVFNPLQCTRLILDPTNATEVTTTSPRCIQLPTNNRTSGTVNTSLNQMQHLYVLSSTAPCTSIPNIFDAANNCFLKSRATPLFSVACPTVYTQYTTLIKNMVAYSYLAGEYNDALVQNLENYLGAYLTISTNMTTFYLDNNVTTAVSAIADNATNISRLSNCSYPNQKLTDVKTAYCENVLPSMFQVFVVALSGLCFIVALTAVVNVAEYPLHQLIAQAKISTDRDVKVRMDTSMNMQPGLPREGFDLNNLTESDQPGPTNIEVYHNILMDNSHHQQDQPIIENHKSISRSAHSVRSEKIQQQGEVSKSDSHSNSNYNSNQNKSNSNQHIKSQTRLKKMDKELSSLKDSVKKTKSELDDKNQEILFQFDEEPINESHHKINLNQEEDVEEIENIDLEEKFPAKVEIVEDNKKVTENDSPLGVNRYKTTEQTEESDIKKITYARSSKNIIMNTKARDLLRRRQQKEQNNQTNTDSVMSIHDFGLLRSQERRKQSDQDINHTTNKQKRRQRDDNVEERK